MDAGDGLPQLIERALAAHEDSSERWALIEELRSHSDRGTFAAMCGLLSGEDPGERVLAADVLGQFGGPHDEPQARPFWGEISEVVTARVVAESEPRALQASIAAAGHLGDVRAIPALCARRTHGDPWVRWGVVMALSNVDDERATGAVVELTADSSALVRDWACHALGVSITSDTLEIRAALLARLDDEDRETREEALRALGRRGVVEAIPALLGAIDGQQQPNDRWTLSEATWLMALNTRDERLRDALSAVCAEFTDDEDDGSDEDLPADLLAAVVAYRSG